MSKNIDKKGKHANEFRRTSFTNSGRIAGHGMVEDNYGEESGCESKIRCGRPILIAEREIEEDDPPVITYYISKEEAREK